MIKLRQGGDDLERNEDSLELTLLAKPNIIIQKCTRIEIALAQQEQWTKLEFKRKPCGLREQRANAHMGSSLGRRS
jgi:hypothetical protein